LSYDDRQGSVFWWVGRLSLVSTIRDGRTVLVRREMEKFPFANIQRFSTVQFGRHRRMEWRPVDEAGCGSCNCFKKENQMAGAPEFTPLFAQGVQRKRRLLGKESIITLAGTLRSSSEAIPDAAVQFPMVDNPGAVRSLHLDPVAPSASRRSGRADWGHHYHNRSRGPRQAFALPTRI